MGKLEQDIKEYNESNIISALKDSDKKAFNKLFRKFYPILCAYCHKFVSLEDSEEIVQDTLLWLWENREKLYVEKNLSSYLFKSVYNRALNKIASTDCRNKVNKLYFEYMQETLQNKGYYQTDELIDKVRESIAKLPESYRQAFMLHRFEGMTYKEIAEQLGVSSKTVDYRIQQSLKLLKEDLNNSLHNYYLKDNAKAIGLLIQIILGEEMF